MNRKQFETKIEIIDFIGNHSDLSGINYEANLHKLEQEGWELVAVVAASVFVKGYFKREVLNF